MRPIKRILCVLDPHRKEQPTLLRARLLADAFDAHVELAITVRQPQLNPHVDALAVALAQYQNDMRGALEKHLSREAEALCEQGISTSSSFSWHQRLADAIAEHAERIDADLIIKDTHYHPAIQRALYTDTDRRLIRSADVPLWLVREHAGIQRGARVVACVDPMQGADDPAPPADQVLEAASIVATRIDSEPHALYVHQPLTAIAAVAEWAVGPAPIKAESLVESAATACHDRFDVLCRRHDVDKERRHFLTGRVEDVLPGALTELGAGVAVLSRSAPRSLGKALLGSTAERILDHTPCDLLMLPA